MKTIKSGLPVLLLLCSAAAAREAVSPNGAWSMTVPESWEPLDAAEYDKLQRGVHSVWKAPEDENKFSDYMMVTVLEQTLHVAPASREDFRQKLQTELGEDKRMQAGIEKVDVARIADRDAYRVEGFLIAPNGPPLKNVKWYVPAGEKVYVFSFTAPGSTFPYKLLAFETMAQSIRMKDAAPAPPGRGVDWRGGVAVMGVLVAIVCAIGILVVARKQFRAATES
ncbi:MAG: hypothetical protein HYY18_02475 [Planctomycetes bacterium]|nr:hypothetical protein [Planctomycetota bacterium]